MAAASTEFKRGTRVVVTDDIPGVPEGTGGKVGRAVGFTLARYRVRFDNKVEATSVAGDKLAKASDWEAFKIDREAERVASAEAAAAAARAPAAAPAPAVETADAGDSGTDPRLAALMAKSKAAKEAKGIVDDTPAADAPAPAPAEAAPAASASAAEMDPRLAELTAKSRAARAAAGVDLDAEDAAPAPEPAADPAPTAEPAAPAAPAAAAPAGPDLGDDYFPADNRVADLLGRVSSGELGQP